MLVRNSIKIVTVAACTLMAGAAPPPESADFVYSGTDDAQGGRLLVKALQGISSDWETTWLSEQDGMLVLDRTADAEPRFKPVIILDVQMVPKGLDRIVVSAMWRGLPGNAEDPKALKFLNHLNSRITGVSFFYSKEGQVVGQAYHDFRNVVVGRDLAEVLSDFDATMDVIMGEQELREGFLRYVGGQDKDRQPDRDA